MKKAQAELEYKSGVKKNYMERMQAQDEQASKNQQQLYELEQQERVMVEKLNQSRMSMGGQSVTALSGNQKPSGVISPYKPRRQAGTVQKKSNQQQSRMLGDEDLNDRVEFDRSIKIVNSPQVKQPVNTIGKR